MMMMMMIMMSMIMVRFYGPLIPAFLVAVLLMIIGEVLIATGKGQVVTTEPPESVVNLSKPHYLMGAVMLIRFLLGFSPIKRLVASTLGLPLDDTRLLEQEGLYFMMLPVFLCTCACAVIYLQTTAAFHFLWMLSYIGRLFSCMPESLCRHAKTFQVLLSVAAMLMTLLCGTLGLLLSAGLLILKVLRLLYIMSRRLDSRDTHASLSLLFPVTLMVNLQALLSLAPLVMWLKSESLLSPLNPDPSRYNGLLTSASVCALIFYDDLVLSRLSDRLFGWSLHVLAVRSVLYASESLYRLPYLISLTLILLLLSRMANRYIRPSEAEGKNE
ncbi:GPI inositol-deacylase [Elysia marginata]|uniref:GPI inositol-deacylase n=1 Tax=Elysia marginata TaxID=1093978 RepID=A0AAV4H8X6_9GAST|nr:GPI inositol-deacylase [Elysia marginata]